MISFHPHVKGDAAGNATFIFVFNSRTPTLILKSFKGYRDNSIFKSLQAASPGFRNYGIGLLTSDFAKSYPKMEHFFRSSSVGVKRTFRGG